MFLEWNKCQSILQLCTPNIFICFIWGGSDSKLFIRLRTKTARNVWWSGMYGCSESAAPVQSLWLKPFYPLGAKDCKHDRCTNSAATWWDRKLVNVQNVQVQFLILITSLDPLNVFLTMSPKWGFGLMFI